MRTVSESPSSAVRRPCGTAGAAVRIHRARSVVACALSLALAGAALAQAPRFGWVHRALPPEGFHTNTVVLGDVDGDGDLDAFLALGFNPIVAVGARLFANERGVFADMTSVWLPAIAYGAVDDVALGDVDLDGDLDAWLHAETGSRLLLNDGSGRHADVTTTHLPAGAQGLEIALGDFDGDADLDAFSLGAELRLYFNSGGGAFTDVSTTHLPQPATGLVEGSAAIGDVDGDGDLDMLLVERFGAAPGRARLYFNNGVGVFHDVTATHLPALSNDADDVALGDVDRDGDLDAWLANFGQDRLYVNGGNGVFQADASRIPAESESTTAVALADMDGDGDLDAFAGNTSIFLGAPGQQARLYRNDGAGAFTDATTLSLPAESLKSSGISAIALGDVDGDTDIDAFIGMGAFGIVVDRLYLNDGAGIFADATEGVPLLDPAQGIALGDVDGDGDSDALLALSDPNPPWTAQDRLLLNRGNGVFSDATRTHLPALQSNSTSVALGDVDSDGDLDALFGAGNAGSVSPQDRLYRNDGSGVFHDVTAGRLPAHAAHTHAVALVDVDRDGDLDAFLAIDTGPSVLL